jgi:hypothetical protein
MYCLFHWNAKNKKMAVSSYFAECNTRQRQLLPSAMTIALGKVANLEPGNLLCQVQWPQRQSPHLCRVLWPLHLAKILKKSTSLPSVCMEAHGKETFFLKITKSLPSVCMAAHGKVFPFKK